MPSGDAPLCVTLNGQPDPAGCAPTPFEAYPATLLRGITPVGGPADGGTLVEVKGGGFASGTGLDCRFETEAEATVVTAQLVDDETLRTVPPQPDGAVAPVTLLDVSVNGQQYTGLAQSFAYLPSPSLSH